MPKNTPTRIIDSQKTRAASFLGGGAAGGGVSYHSALGGLLNDDHPQYHNDARGDVRYVPVARTVATGGGLTGGGDLTADRTFAVGAGLGITVNADDVALTTPGTLTVSSTNNSTGSHTHAITTSSDVGTTPAASILASTAAGALTVATLYANVNVSTSRIDTASSNLTLAPATNVVSLLSAVAVQTDNYASQLTGWRATYAGEADFRYLFVDEMHAKSFIADLEQALAGGQIICKSVAMVASAFTVPAASGTATLRVRDLPSAANMAAFVSGDIVRLRTFSRSGGSLTIADCWGVVTSYADQTDGTQTWTFTRSAAPNAGGISAGATIAPDSIVLDYGTTGNGYYEVNAIDGAYGLNSPYARIATWTTHPATGTALRAQFGNLRGVYGYSGTEFGVAMGSATGANVTVDATNGVRLRQGTTDMIVLNPSGASYFAGVMTIDTNGEIRQGTGTLGSNYTGLRIWRDTGIGRIGGYNTNVLQWYGSTDGKFYFAGGKGWLERYGFYILAPAAADMGIENNIAWPTQGNLSTLSGYINCGFAGSSGSPDGQMTIAVNKAGTANRINMDTNAVNMGGDLTVTGEINVRQHTTMEQWSLDCANGTALTMANTFVFQFSDASVFSGLVVINNTTDGGGGVFMCSGGVVTKIADGSSVYSTTKDTASKTNLYYDAGSSEYRMQNNTGGSRTYNIFTIRLRAAS